MIRFILFELFVSLSVFTKAPTLVAPRLEKFTVIELLTLEPALTLPSEQVTLAPLTEQPEGIEEKLVQRGGII